MTTTPVGPAARASRAELKAILRDAPVSAPTRAERSMQAHATGWAAAVHGILVVWALSIPVAQEPIKRAAEPARPQPVWLVLDEKPTPKAPAERAEAPAPLLQTAAATPTPVKAAEERVSKKVSPAKKTRRVVAKKKKFRKATKPVVAEAPRVVGSDSEEAPSIVAAGMQSEAGATRVDEPAPSPSTQGSENGSATVTIATETEVDLDGIRVAYIGAVNAAFQRERMYPRAAKRAGLEGKVVVEVVIDAAGDIVGTRILKSSGHSILDAAAVESIKDVSELPAPPKALGWTSRSMRIPFVYRLT